MRRYLIAAIAGLLASGSPAWARCLHREDDGSCFLREVRGRCLLQVHGHTYLRGPCYAQMDKWGGLQIGPIGHPRHYHFSVVSADRDHPNTSDFATWNGVEGASHAQESLGTLTRHGACWSNDRARVCAWKR